MSLDNGGQFQFAESKSGELTCSFQGKYLHSKYNPTAEGEKFALGAQCDFSPLCVFVLEPCLSYCAPFLRKKFPDAKICAIRFFKDFSGTDKNWDSVFYLEKSGEIPLGERLFNNLGEEKLLSSLALDWLPSKQIFPGENILAWGEIKKAVLKARDVLGTRSYFSKRWLKNSLIFSSLVNSCNILEKGESPVIIASSGESLASSIPFIKKYRSRHFLIALSSSFMPLLRNGIMPDLVLSSDGGFWAKKHLAFPDGNADTVFALEAEGAAPRKLLSEKKILPLSYPDGLEKNFLEAIRAPCMISERNGTVAGTALVFALSSVTSGKVYLCGQDLAPSPAFQHTQPNALETLNEKNDFRLAPKETRITRSRFSSSAALEIYRNWFVSNSEYFSARVSRLSDNFSYEFSLGKIKETNWEDFEKDSLKIGKMPKFIQKKIGTSQGERKKIILTTLESLSKTSGFADEVFPLDSILIRREISEEKRAELQKNLEEKVMELIRECEKTMHN